MTYLNSSCVRMINVSSATPLLEIHIDVDRTVFSPSSPSLRSCCRPRLVGRISAICLAGESRSFVEDNVAEDSTDLTRLREFCDDIGGSCVSLEKQQVLFARESPFWGVWLMEAATTGPGEVSLCCDGSRGVVSASSLRLPRLLVPKFWKKLARDWRRVVRSFTFESTHRKG